MKSNIVIIGAGGFAKEVFEVLMNWLNWKQESHKFLGFLDDNIELHGKDFMGFKIIGGLDWLASNQDVDIVLGIGAPHIKKIIVEKISEIGDYKFLTLIDENAIVGNDVRIGNGVFIGAGSILTTNIDMKDFTTVNLACTIGHDCTIEPFVTIAPGVNISGNCTLKEGVDFGTGGTIIQGKCVEEWSIIGAGSVVVRDIPANVTAVGNPSKVIKERNEGWHLPSAKQSVK